MPSLKYQSVDVNDVSHISAGTVIKGEITSMTDIRVDGTVEGKLYTENKVVIGEQARLKGTLLCSNLDIWGTMNGDIFVKDVLSIKQTAVIKGDLHMSRLQVELGARFDGNCKMMTEQEAGEINLPAPEETEENS